MGYFSIRNVFNHRFYRFSRLLNCKHLISKGFDCFAADTDTAIGHANATIIFIKKLSRWKNLCYLRNLWFLKKLQFMKI